MNFATRTERTIEVIRLGRIAYRDAMACMEARVAARTRGEVGDALFLLEHPPTITLGRKERREHVLLSDADLEARGIELHAASRGGDVTYHGPGQIVGYPVLDLRPDRADVRRYVGDLEEVMLRVTQSYGLRAAGRVQGLNGIWIDDARKIGAIGVRIARWITSHGFALNVTLEPEAFHVIVPCGIVGRGVTSIRNELGRDVDLDDAFLRAERAFLDVFCAGATSNVPLAENR